MTNDPELAAAMAAAAEALAARKGNVRDGVVWCASCRKRPAAPTQLECQPCIKGAKYPAASEPPQRSFFETEREHDL